MLLEVAAFVLTLLLITLMGEGFLARLWAGREGPIPVFVSAGRCLEAWMVPALAHGAGALSGSLASGGLARRKLGVESGRGPPSILA